SHAEGHSCEAPGPVSHAEGEDSVVEGFRSHAEGEGCWVKPETTTAAHAEGSTTRVTKSCGHAQGGHSGASRWGQDAHAGGSFEGGAFDVRDPGSAQSSQLVLRGETHGTAAHELAYLQFGHSEMVVRAYPGGAYALDLLAIATGQIDGE